MRTQKVREKSEERLNVLLLTLSSFLLASFPFSVLYVIIIDSFTYVLSKMLSID